MNLLYSTHPPDWIERGIVLALCVLALLALAVVTDAEQPKLGAAITISGVVRFAGSGPSPAPAAGPLRHFAIRGLNNGDSLLSLPDGEASQGLAQFAASGTQSIRVIITEGP